MDPQWLPQHEALSETYLTMMLRGIVNFRIPVTRLETRWKLSQNKGRREMELLAAELEKSADPMERALAALTRKHLPEK
jgi:transcriptional regulator